MKRLTSKSKRETFLWGFCVNSANTKGRAVYNNNGELYMTLFCELVYEERGRIGLAVGKF